jgi:uncharacterized protein (TIGR02145 family)
MNGAESSNSNPSKVQGVCPTGCHLPSDEEWKELEMYLGMSQAEADKTGWHGTNEGGKMKDTVYWVSPNTGATNESGFSAFPGGYRDYKFGYFYNLHEEAKFWSSTESGIYNAFIRGLQYDRSDIITYTSNYKNTGASVRCIMD